MLGAGTFANNLYGAGGFISTPEPPLPPLVQRILDYYADLLIIQYRSKTRARKTVRLAADQSLCGGFIYDEKECFDIDTAVGAQLDILGRIVGVPRVIYTFNLGNTFFNFTNYFETPDIIAGFGNYEDDPYNPEGNLTYTYGMFNNISVTLTDAQMRDLIKMRIELNTSVSSFKFIKDFIYEWLNSDVQVVDNQDMTLTYTIAASFSTLARAAFYLKMLPVPAGVKPEYIFQ